MPGGTVANTGMGVHFLGGGLLLVLGNLQFVTPLRDRWPVVHRALGRVYIAAALLAGVGGLLFIALRGCVGGPLMDVAFAGYGVLMVLAASQTVRHAVARRTAVHRQWAVRLYALAVGSWLYRMGYGFWFMLTDGIGVQEGFSGPFDYVMDFAFYVPGLIVAEGYLRAAAGRVPPGLRIGLAAVMGGAVAFIALATFFFAKEYWLPGIAVGLGG